MARAFGSWVTGLEGETQVGCCRLARLSGPAEADGPSLIFVRAPHCALIQPVTRMAFGDRQQDAKKTDKNHSKNENVNGALPPIQTDLARRVQYRNCANLDCRFIVGGRLAWQTVQGECCYDSLGQ